MTVHCEQATPTNAAYLSSKTGLDPRVALAWLKNECQDQINFNPSNPLNIMAGGTPGQIGKLPNAPGGVYPSTQAGLDAAAWLIKNSSHYSGIRAAIATGDPVRQAEAIQNSPWAGGHYGYNGIVGTLKSLSPSTIFPDVTQNLPSMDSGAGGASTLAGSTSNAASGIASFLGKKTTDTLTSGDIDKLAQALWDKTGQGVVDPGGFVQQSFNNGLHRLLDPYVNKPISAIPNDALGAGGFFSAIGAGVQGTVDTGAQTAQVGLDLVGALVQIATYLIAIIIIVAGIWLYARSQKQQVEFTTPQPTGGFSGSPVPAR